MVRDLIVVRLSLVTPSGPPPQQLAWLEEDERVRAQRRGGGGIDTVRALTAATSLRALVSEHTGVPPDAVEIGREPRGRPVLLHPRGWHVSVSHAGAVVLCALGTRPVGIDVEPRPGPEADEVLLRRTCTPAERRDLDRLDPDRRRAALLRAWVRKEAVAKAWGQGLHQPFTQVDVRRARVPDPEGARRWTVRDLPLGQGVGETHVAAVAAAGWRWRSVIA